MHKRPPLPSHSLHLKTYQQPQGLSVNADEEAWIEIRKQGLKNLDKVRSVKRETSLNATPTPQPKSPSSPGLDQATQEQEGDSASAEESSSLYSFWHDIGPTLSAILAIEEIGQQILKLKNHSSVSSISDADLDREIISKDFTSSLTPIAKHTSPRVLPTSEINSSLGLKAQEQEKYLKLNSERGAIIGPHGASRFLTWQQLITARAVTPSLISIPPLEKRKGVGARASQKRRKMRIARVKARYHKSSKTSS